MAFAFAQSGRSNLTGRILTPPQLQLLQDKVVSQHVISAFTDATKCTTDEAARILYWFIVIQRIMGLFRFFARKPQIATATVHPITDAPSRRARFTASANGCMTDNGERVDWHSIPERNHVVWPHEAIFKWVGRVLISTVRLFIIDQQPVASSPHVTQSEVIQAIVEEKGWEKDQTRHMLEWVDRIFERDQVFTSRVVHLTWVDTSSPHYDRLVQVYPPNQRRPKRGSAADLLQRYVVRKTPDGKALKHQRDGRSVTLAIERSEIVTPLDCEVSAWHRPSEEFAAAA